jgi:hypothetical protein
MLIIMALTISLIFAEISQIVAILHSVLGGAPRRFPIKCCLDISTNINVST